MLLGPALAVSAVLFALGAISTMSFGLAGELGSQWCALFLFIESLAAACRRSVVCRNARCQ